MAANIIIGIFIGLMIGGGVWADETVVPDVLRPQKIQSLVQQSKLLEGQILTRQKNANERQDPAAKQYYIGYKDGYNKAVLDLLKSQLLGGVAITPSTVAQQTPRPATTIAPSAVTSTTAATMPITTLETPSTNTNINVPVAAAPSGIAPAPGSITSTAMPQTAVAPRSDTAKMSASQSSAVNSTPTARLMPDAAQTHEHQFQTLMSKSTASLEAKNWSEAVSFASAAIAVKADSSEAFINRSWAFAEQGMFKKAMTDANQAVVLGPNNPLAYNNRAYTYDLMEDLPKARVDYQRACTLGFNNACGIVAKIDEISLHRKNRIAALTSQSQQLIAKRDWTGLIDLSNQILALDKMHSLAYVNRSWAYAELGDYKKALIDADAAIELDPGDALAFNNRAYTYDLMGDLPKAKVDYQKACQLKLTRACDVVVKINQIENKAKAKKVARQVPGKKIAANKTTAVKRSAPQSKQSKISALITQSLEKFRQGNWHAVEQLSNHVLKIDPRNALAYVNRAGARTEMGLFYNAVDDTDRAIQLNPKLGIAYNNKGYALERMGNLRKAAKQYQKACKLGIKQSCNDFNRLSATVSKKSR